MSNYSQVTFFAPKDVLISGNPAKLIKGADIDPELAAISAAITSKFDNAGGSVTGDVTTGGSVKALGGTYPGVSASVAQLIAGAGVAAVYLIDASQGTDSKFWPVFTSSGNFGIGATNDADSVTRIAFNASRTGNAITAVGLGNATDKPAITLNGPTTIPAPTSGVALTVTAASGVAPMVSFIGNGARATVLFTDGSAGNRAWETGSGIGGVGNFGAFDSTASLVKFVVAGGATNAITGLGPVAAAQVDMTPDTGTGAVQCTVGMTTTPSVTGKFFRIGKLAFLEIPALTGTATGSPTVFTITVAFPAGFTPSTNKAMPAYVTNNGQPQPGFLTFGATGISLFQAPTTVFTGTCGFNLAVVISYPID